MSKELEALDRNIVVIKEKDYTIIEKSLQRLESIDNAKPSEALERINALIDGIDNYEKQTGRKNPPAYIGRETLVELQQALLKAQEQEKVLKVIKEKNVEVFTLHHSIDVDYYNSYWNNDMFCLTQEEFDLLKRWVG